MHKTQGGMRGALALTLAFSIVAVLVLFYWEGHLGYNLWDEGFLWYGVQRVLAGEVPMRDFMAYEPGRYYWSAVIMNMTGNNGIVGLRVAAALLGVVSLFFGLFLLWRDNRRVDIPFWGMTTATQAIWIYPWFKIFDIAASVFLITALALLQGQTSVRRSFLTGFSVGLIAFIGRNHGLYGVAGSCLTLAYLAIGSERPRYFLRMLGFGVLGVIAGLGPFVLMAVTIPGYGVAVWDGIRFLAEQGATNLPLPVPWPWHVPFGQLTFVDAAGQVVLGIFFLAIITFGLVGSIWVCWRKWRGKVSPPVLVASVFLALPYAHYAFSRADVVHLALGIFPFLVGMSVIIARCTIATRYLFALLLLIGSSIVVLPMHPGWEYHAKMHWVEMKIGNDTIKVDPIAANDLELLKRLERDFASGGRSILVAPYWPGAYAVLDRKSPMWANYALWPRSVRFQRAEIESIEAANPGFALILDLPLDGREELRFRNTNPLIDEYIKKNFEFIPDYGPDPVYQIYRRR